MAVLGMNHFTVLTDDVPRTVEFYSRLLGSPTGRGPHSVFRAHGCTRATTPCCTSWAASRAKSCAQA
jgi:catechol 2,3-dioxygenase-like lactoylglutathione lyase family enzyme